MHKLYLIIGFLFAIHMSYGQRNFSEVIEVDSANINVLKFKLIDSFFHVSSIFISTSNISSSSIVTSNIHNLKNTFFEVDSFSLTRPSPLISGKKYFLFGKNRELLKSQEIKLVSKNYEILNSVEFDTKGDFNFSMRPVTLNDNLYLPTYIEDGEQEYFSLTKVTSDLEVLWTKYYNEDFAYSVPAELSASPDSNLYVSSNVYVEEERRYYNQLLKLDTSGNVIWEYFNTEELEHGAVSPWFTTLSNSNIVVSYRVSRRGNDTFFNNYLHWYPYRLQWLNGQGNVLKKKYFTSERLTWFYISKVEKGRGDYFYMMGNWENGGEGTGVKNLLLKLNNQGDSLWHRTYYHPDYSLDSVSFSVVDIHEFEDGRIAVLSMISTPYDWNKIWIYMVDSEGNCLTENCISEGDVVSMNTYEIKYEKLTLYPNPTRDRLYWRQDIALQDVRVYDIFGRPVIEVGGEPVFSLNLGTLPAGTYILQGQDRAGKNYRAKFILQ